MTFKTQDNLKIRGWYATSPFGRRLLIIIHGFDLTHKDMINRSLGVYPEVADICLIDLRNHGLSESSSTTFGYREALDVEAVTKYFSAKYDEIIIWGSSMGAAAAVRAARLGASVDMLILEGLYDDLSNAIAIQAKHYFIPRIPFVLIGLFFYQHISGVDLKVMNMCENLKTIDKIPVLLIHSRADQEVPMSSFNSLKESLGNNGKAFILERGGHVSIYEENLIKYRNRVMEFIVNKK
ncbi:alpha/beta hydrolase [Thermodesulfobacteriota bacterium]